MCYVQDEAGPWAFGRLALTHYLPYVRLSTLSLGSMTPGESRLFSVAMLSHMQLLFLKCPTPSLTFSHLPCSLSYLGQSSALLWSFPFSLSAGLLLIPFAPIACYIEPEPLKTCVNEWKYNWKKRQGSNCFSHSRECYMWTAHKCNTCIPGEKIKES